MSKILILIVPLFIVISTWSNFKTCQEQDLQAVKNFYNVFNHKNQLSKDNPVDDSFLCEKFLNFEHQKKNYTGYRYATKGKSGGLIYFVYEDQLVNDEKNGLFRKMRLLQPWESAYIALILEHNSGDSEILNIIDREREFDRYCDNELLASLNSNGFKKIKTELEYFGNYADNWNVVLGNNYMYLINLAMNFNMILNEVQDYPKIKSQQLIETVYWLENKKGKIVFACDTLLKSAKEKNLKLLEMRGDYLLIRNGKPPPVLSPLGWI